MDDLWGRVGEGTIRFTFTVEGGGFPGKFSMRKMQQIQPRLRTLQEKYGDDKAKLNQELMKLYKDEGI
ncbi:YidC/Oxa1 family membrane protein insertase, partial [Acetomicrobium sp. S15 = DSM 107314]|uniref:YidC/Oxa1 family membrane protein insertase n=1 Tax=Acetomicrobium sp. S15 = DSM 107314 TaxID=2529858 RepID=UPI001E2DCEF8